MFICIKADYAKRIQFAQSTEETRYYLNGFNVAPNPDGNGVTIVATDGHLMSAFHDADGASDAGHNDCIVQLSKQEISACKPGKFGEPWLVIEGDFKQTRLTIATGANAEEAMEFARDLNTASPLRTIGRHFIDGTFPDWRRVLPDAAKCIQGMVSGVNSRNVERLGKCVDAGKGACLRFYQQEPTFPMLVRAASREDWVGVLMGMRFGGDKDVASFPAWVNATPSKVEEAVAAVAAE